MTAQSSANKAGAFYKFLPYYLNKLRYLKAQIIMNSIFAVLTYPSMAAVFLAWCSAFVANERIGLNAENATKEQLLQINEAGQRLENLQALLITSIVIAVLCCFGLFVFTFVTTNRGFRYLYNKTAVDMDYALPVNHNTRFFGDLAAVLTASILPHLLAILIGLLLSGFIGLTGIETDEISAVLSIIRQLAFAGLFACIMQVGLSLLVISFCGRAAEAGIYPVLVSFALPVIHTLGIYLVESGVYGTTQTGLLSGVGNVYPIASTSPLGIIFTSFYSSIATYYKDIAVPIFTAQYGIPALIVTLAFFAGAYFLMKHRRTERVGMPFVYRAMGVIIPGIVIFAVVMPICTAISAVLRDDGYTSSISGMVIGMIISTFILYAIMELIAGRNFRKFHISAAKWAGTLAACIAICAALNFSNGFGMANYVPDASSVAEVMVMYDGECNDTDELEYRSYYFTATDRDTELLELIEELHTEIPKYKTDDASPGYSISFDYTMKNGQTLSRAYYLSEDMGEDFNRRLITPQSWMIKQYGSMLYNVNEGYEIDKITFYGSVSDISYKIDGDKLVEAIKLDCERMNYDFLAGLSQQQDNMYCSVGVTYKSEREISDSRITVYSWMTNTVAVINEAISAGENI